MLKKQQNKKNKVTKVTFTLPAEVEGDTVHLVGEFNDWQPSQAMKRQKDGSWQLAVELEPERKYQFRYLIDEQWWLNDPEADEYAPNPYGEENSVVLT